jgi:RNA polymerase sigma-70 factor, ECF subfamily
MSHEPDEALYARVRQQGEMSAFDELYQRHERRLFAYLRGYLPVRADAEEVLHDAFLQVLRSREVRFEQGSFTSWLYRIARNLALNRLRSGRRAADARAAISAPAELPRADQQVEAEERTRVLAEAVATLPQPLAELYQLRTGGMSYEDIAFALGVPLGTVKSRSHELVSRLKEGVRRWTKS